MSFDFSIDDFSLLADRAFQVRKQCLEAGNLNQHLARSLNILYIVLDNTRLHLRREVLDAPNRKRALVVAQLTCEVTLNDVETSLSSLRTPELKDEGDILAKRVTISSSNFELFSTSLGSLPSKDLQLKVDQLTREGKQGGGEGLPEFIFEHDRDVFDDEAMQRLVADLLREEAQSDAMEMLHQSVERRLPQTAVDDVPTGNQDSWSAAVQSELLTAQDHLDSDATLCGDDTSTLTASQESPKHDASSTLLYAPIPARPTGNSDYDLHDASAIDDARGDLRPSSRIRDPGRQDLLPQKEVVLHPSWSTLREGKAEAVQRHTAAGQQRRKGYHDGALSVASHRGQIQIVKVLLEKGADINAKGRRYGSALDAASFGGHVEIVNVLLENGADVNAGGGYYGSPLGAASFGGHVEIVNVLLDKGANVNAKGGVHGSALEVASLQGHVEIVRMLLEKGADINANGGTHGSALRAALYGARPFAATINHVEVVKLLLAKGVDITGVRAWLGEQDASRNATAIVVPGIASRGIPIIGYARDVRVLLEEAAKANAQGGRHDGVMQTLEEISSRGSTVTLSPSEHGSLRGVPTGTTASPRYAGERMAERPLPSCLYRWYRDLKHLVMGSSHALEPSIREGAIRVRWKCRCGKHLFDDYEELQPGAARRMEELLNRHSVPHSAKENVLMTTHAGSGSGSSQSTAGGSSSTNAPPTLTSGLVTGDSQQAGSPSSPGKGQASNKSSGRPQSQQTNSTGSASPLWLMVCLNVARRTTRLNQREMHKSDMISDRDLAISLRRLWQSVNGNWYTRRGMWRFFRFRGLTSIEFVRFRYRHHNEIVDPRTLPPTVPPTGLDYEFERTDLDPPLGPQALLHLFEHPHEYADSLEYYRLLPKKLSRLHPPESEGWGIRFIESYEAWRLWLYLFLCFGLGAVIFGVVYGLVMSDLSTAFTIAAVFTAFPPIIAIPISDYQKS